MKRADKHGRVAANRTGRQRIAYEAARLMALHGVQDYHQAKLKAAQHLGIADEAALPRNAEVQAQLRDYQRLFQGDEQPRQLRLRREAALPAMEFFAAFQPRLFGSVLDGTADGHSPICLQAFSDDADEFARFLLESNLPAKLAERKLHLDREQSISVPAWTFAADGLEFEVSVLPTTLLRQAPLGHDGKPMPRASLTTLRKLLAESEIGVD